VADDDVPEIDVDELARRLDAGATLIDVRNPHEYEAGHVPGARLIPLGDLPDRTGEVAIDHEVLLICRTGSRSMVAAEYLRQQGMDVVNVAGGTLAWIESGRPAPGGAEPT
jgi:rhodanese-related sulfurtransferase